jgi:hypothetical protein
MTKMIDADAILKRAEPLIHQHAPERSTSSRCR